MKERYEAALKSGMFWVWFPHLTGNWNEDMAEFIEYVVTKCSR